MSSQYERDYESLRLICFRLESTLYAIEIKKIKEIITIPEIRHIPGTPFYVEGVFSLRSEIIPVVDLRKLMAIQPVPKSTEKVIIYEVQGHEIGFIVDEVAQVIQIEKKHILPPPAVVMRGLDPQCIQGVLELGSENGIIFSLEKILSQKEASKIADLAQAHA